MLLPVRVDNWVQLVGAELPPQQLDVVALAGEEVPARPHAVRLGVPAEHLRRVALRVERDRQQGHVATGAVTQGLLHLDEVLGGERAGDTTGREHEVDRHDLAAHEVVVEADAPALVGHELDVREVAVADGGHRIGRRRGGARRRRPLGRGRRAFRATRRAERDDKGEGQGRAGWGHGWFSNCAIIRMSSCSMLWQWKT